MNDERLKMLKDKRLIRKAGMSEQAVIARSFNRFYNNFAFVGIYSQNLTSSLIYQVLRRMLLKFSYLTANYDKDTNTIFPVSKIYFSQVFEFRKTDNSKIEQFLDDIEKFHFPLNDGKPLFKLILVNEVMLAVVFEHALVDGVSGANFHKVFLSILNSLTKEQLQQELDLNPQSLIFDLEQDVDKLNPFPLCTEEYLNYEPDLFFRLRRNLKAELPQALAYYIGDHQYSSIPQLPDKKCSKWPGIDGKKDFRTAFKYFNIPPEVVRKAIKLCRSKHVTITPFIEIIMCQTLCKMGIITDSNLAAENYFIKSMNPSDLRKFLDPKIHENLELGLRVNPGIFNYLLIEELMKSSEDKNIFWELVRKSYNNISQSSTDPKAIVTQWYSLKGSYDENSLSSMALLNSNGFRDATGPTLRLSNLGLLKNDNKKAVFFLKDAFFTQSLGVNGGCIVANVVSTELGGMNICCSCMEDLFGDETRLDDFISTFKQAMISHINAIENL